MTTSTTEPTTRVRGQMYRVTLTDRGRSFVAQPDTEPLPEPLLATPDQLDTDWVLLSSRLHGGWDVADAMTEHLSDEVTARLEPGTKGHYVRQDMVATFEPLPGDASLVAALAEDSEEAPRPPMFTQADLDRAVLAARSQAERRGEQNLAAYKDTIRDALIAEGERREWCDELDEFLSDNGFEPRVVNKDYEVTLTVQFEVTVRIEGATDEDTAIEQAENDINGSMTLDPFSTLSPTYGSVDLEVTNSEARETD
jgi:hypothetical protein